MYALLVFCNQRTANAFCLLYSSSETIVCAHQGLKYYFGIIILYISGALYTFSKDISYQSKCLLHSRAKKTEAQRKKQSKTVLDLTWNNVPMGEMAYSLWVLLSFLSNHIVFPMTVHKR